MNSIYNLKQEIRNYEILKNNIYGLITSLNNSSTSISKVKTHMKDIYTINGEESNIIKNTEVLKTNISETSNYLKNTILSTIDLKIREIERKIKDLELNER